MNANNIVPGWTGVQRFEVNNPNNASISYDMKWVNVKNTFIGNFMRFSLYRDGVLLISNTPVPKTDEILKTNEVIAKNSKNTYEIRYEFVENNQNQDVEKNKTFKSSLNIIAKGVTN